VAVIGHIEDVEHTAELFVPEEVFVGRRRHAGQTVKQLAALGMGGLIGVAVGFGAYNGIRATQETNNKQINEHVKFCARDLQALQQPLAAAGMPMSCKAIEHRLSAILPRDYVTYAQMGSVNEFVRDASVQPYERENQRNTAIEYSDLAGGIAGGVVWFTFAAIFAAQSRHREREV
jgi:hypothetical protein